MKEFV
ncbi:hypothetical protein RDI58_014939 [Solanum bulbocastanum]